MTRNMNHGNQHTPWSADDVAALKQMRAEGKSLAEIARAITKTRSACAGMVSRLGLPLPAGRAGAWVTVPRPCRPKREPRAPKPVKPPKLVIVAAPSPPPPVVSTLNARPWMSRASRECAWLLDDGCSCCAPVTRGSYCAGHAALMYRPVKKLGVEKMARQYG